MCGRYSLTTAIDRLLPRLRGPLPPGLLEHYQPRPQVRPGEPVLIQRENEGRPEVALARWGLLPAWLKDPRGRSRPINARSETVADKPYFRGAWRHHRCLLPADGFFEWRADEWRPEPQGSPARGRRRRQPYWIRRLDGEPFWLGGLWDRWLGADGSELDSCCILTTAPNALLRPIHDRMPVVIPRGEEQRWLQGRGGAQLAALEPLLAPWDPAGWEAVPVDDL
jgi:putative SOS response-associated peptidase YedK